MKTKTLLTAIVLSMVLVSCMPVPTGTPKSTVTATSTPIPATPKHQPTAPVTQSNLSTSTPVVKENASEDCFWAMDFIPKKTRTYEVRSAWDNPVKKSSLDAGLENWYFDFSGTPLVSFKDQTLDTVTFYLKGCTLEKIIAQLGPPEKVEIITLVSCIDLQHLWVTQNLHYTSLGFSYFRSCDETQDCFTFHPSDILGGKEFYASGKIIEDSTGFNMSGYVYNWHGFDVNVEVVEDKVEDFPSGTPTP